MKNLIILVLLSILTYAQSQKQQAVVVLRDLRDVDNQIFGTIYFTNNGSGSTPTFVRANISNVEDGEYGMLIHEFGDYRGFIPEVNENIAQWRAFGNIFNPDNSPRGCPDNGTRGAFGDLGNWNAASGIRVERALTRHLPLTGANSLIGRSVALYDSAFDCNDLVNYAGTPIAVGIIGISQALPGTPRNIAVGDPSNTRGVCVLSGTSFCNGDERECDFGQIGVFLLERSQTSDGVRILGVVNGLNEVRGLHIHEFGDLSENNGSSAGDHYNREGYQHGLPGVNGRRHVGDLGNIQNFEGNTAFYDNTPEYAPIASFSVSNFIGRALVIHSSYDHGNDPTCNEGASSGNAGNRQFICVIGLANSNDTDFFVPVIPDSLSNINNTFAQVPCAGGAVTTTTGNTNNNPGGVVVLPTSGNTDDNNNDDEWDDWRVPEDASAPALVGSIMLLLIINFVVLFV